MAKRPTLTDVTSGFGTASVINSNNAAIETAFDNTLSRDGSTPNQMEASIDMNSNKVLNLPNATSNSEPATYGQLQDVVLTSRPPYGVNVKSFGAVGDGVADDTTAIEDALAASDNVYFPEGLYVTTKALRLTGDKKIQGDGKGASRIIRTNTTAETIDSESVTATVYVSGRYNSIENLGIRGDRSGTETSASVDGIHLGGTTTVASNSSFRNLDIRNCNNCIKATKGVFMMTFEQINCANSVNAYNFSAAVAKTSLTFNSCWCENVGQAYEFNNTVYTTFNSCGADYANYTSGTGTAGANPYGFGFGTQSGGKGVYDFTTSTITLNSCGAEYSYGDGIFTFQGSCTATLNSPYQAGCSSEYTPPYGTYGDIAVGPIQCRPAGNMNTITINAPSTGLASWTNPNVATNYPTRPISDLLAFNYVEGVYGVKTGTRAFITSAAGVQADIIKGIGSSTYATLADEFVSLNILPDRIQKFTRRITPAGTTTTATITLPSDGSWSPAIVKVAAASEATTGGFPGAGGTVYSIYGVKLLSGNTAQANESVDLLTSTDISIAATYGTDQIIITATVTAGHRVIWDIETTTYENGTVTVAYA